METNVPITCPKCGTQYQVRTYRERREDGSLKDESCIDTRCPTCSQRQREGAPETPVRRPLAD